MRLSPAQARERFAVARVARLATAGADGRPHLVPVTFAVDADSVVFAVDHKPKSTTDLRRIRNIAENPRVSLLADDYDEDWTRLWWARADGLGAVVDDVAERQRLVQLLCAKYPQYHERPPRGTVVRIDVTSWSGWSAA